MSIARPIVVNGFLICDETVSSCTVVKKNAFAERVDVGSARVPLGQEDEDRPGRVDDQRSDQDQEEPRDQAAMVSLPPPQVAELLADHARSFPAGADALCLAQ